MIFPRRIAASFLVVIAVACSTGAPAPSAARDPNPGIDSLNARLSKAYRDRDPVAYGTIFTDSAVFEWPAVQTVRGRPGLEAMARANWASLSDMDLTLDVAQRRVAADHVTEFGAFHQAYRDSAGARFVEHGRYVALLVPAGDGWKMDRFFGFSDSTSKVASGPARPK